MRFTAAAAIVILALSAPAGAQSLKDGVMVAGEAEAVVTVEKVDQKERAVWVRGPRGNVVRLDVPPEAQNLDRVKKGDRFRMKYVEAVAISITKGGAPSHAESRDVRVSPKGGTPGGVVVRTRQASVVIDAIDYAGRYVSVRGPAGSMSLKVADDVNLKELSAGDRVTVVHTAALAVQLEAQAPAKKPAANKKS